MPTPQQALNYVVNKERGQTNKQQILRANITNWNAVSYVRQNKTRMSLLSTQQEPTSCGNSGSTFSMAHLQTCPEKTMQTKFAKSFDITHHCVQLKCQKEVNLGSHKTTKHKIINPNKPHKPHKIINPKGQTHKTRSGSKRTN